ncbi:MAG: UvrD-helicase domain-containing protein, partial [Gemmatimonadales bacterium]|nr:UvrD-helicase domain-containing protein [Gemmatimonadales bacterium]
MTAPFNPMAVTIEPGPLVLEASAGTGKTYTIVQFAVRILMGDSGVLSRGPRHLLLVTFTKAATAELRGRLRDAIRAVEEIHLGRRTASPAEEWVAELLARTPDATQRVARLVERLDELSVTTIHGFCVGVLDEYPYECGVPASLTFTDDDASIVIELLDDLARERSWRDPWHAAAMISDCWSRDDVLTLVRTLRRYGTPPTSPAPDPGALGVFQDALQRARADWDKASLLDALNSAVWFEKKTLLAEPAARRALVDQLDRLLAGDPSGLGALDYLDPGKLYEGLQKKGKELKALQVAVTDHPSMVALQQTVDARDAWLRSARLDFALELLTRLPECKAERAVATFDDQIRLVSDAMSRSPRLVDAMHERFDAVLVDEAQDTDPAQWTIFNSAFTKRPLIIVGDPKQAIYSWRGADLQAYLDTRRAAGEGRVFRLERNWRSSQRLLDGLASLFTRAPDPFGVPAAHMDFIPVAAGRDAASLDDPDSTAALRWIVPSGPSNKDNVKGEIREQVVREIVRLTAQVTLKGAQVLPGDIAVLVRTHAEAADYQDSLRSVGVNAVISGSGDVTETAVWSEVLAVLEAVAMPESISRLRAAAATVLLGESAADLYAWRSDVDHPRFVALRDQFREALDRSRAFGPFSALVRLLGESGAMARLASRDDGERRLTDLRHVLELLQEAESDINGNVMRLAQWMMHWPTAADADTEKRQIRLESDADAVQIRTMHVAKGLEWPIVFAPSCWDGRDRTNDELVVVRDAEGWQGHFNDSPDRAVADTMALAAGFQENLRLAYVALTRAKSRCYVAVGCGSSQKARGAMGWLLRGVDSAADGAAKDEWPDVTGAVGAMVAASGGGIDIVTMSAVGEAEAPVADATPVLAQIVRREDPRKRIRTWTTTSYTSLIEKGQSARDVADPSVVEVVPAPAEPPDLDLLPMGARSGVAVHALFERIDFDASDAEIRSMAADILLEYGILADVAGADHDRLIDAVATMARGTLRTPIPGLGFALCDVPREKTLREWRFNLALDQFRLADVADRLRASGEQWLAEYADSIAQLTP